MQQSTMRAHGYLNNILAAEDASRQAANNLPVGEAFFLISDIWRFLPQFQYCLLVGREGGFVDYQNVCLKQTGSCPCY